MPLYEFSCERCGTFAAWRTIDARDQPAPCPKCGGGARRCLARPRLQMLSHGVRAAHAINERSSHEPTVLRAHHCSSTCGCGSPSSSSSLHPKLSKRQQRPWMLGH